MHTNTSRDAKIQDDLITSVAFHDMPLLNSVEVQEPFALRSVIEVVVGGKFSLGESYDDSVHLEHLRKTAKKPVGISLYNSDAMCLICSELDWA